MSLAVVTGSAGLIGSETCRRFAAEGFDVVGIDNDMRAEFFHTPRCGEVYNLGGSRHSNCSLLEAIDLCAEISGRKLDWTDVEDNRIGDPVWWVNALRRFQEHYSHWQYRYDLPGILHEIHRACLYA